MPQELIEASAVARELSLHPATVRRWAKQGRLPYVKLPSGRIRFRRADIDALVDAPHTDAA